MTGLLSAEASQFGKVVEESLSSETALHIARTAETNPSTRLRCDDVLSGLGLWDIDPYGDLSHLEAAAAAVQAAGRVALPYPLAERLAAADLVAVDAIAFVDEPSPRISHGGLGLNWLALNEESQAPVVGEGPMLGTKLGAFVADVELGPSEPVAHPRHLTMLLTLQGWALLGMLETAAAETYQHVKNRHQFGSPLASFQGLRFALTDVEVDVQGLREVARYTLWSVGTSRREARADALALRLTALEAAETVFRTCHQAHGAMGLCDESDLSWLSRHSQPLRRLPWGRTRTERALLKQLLGAPLAGPFNTFTTQCETDRTADSPTRDRARTTAHRTRD